MKRYYKYAEGVDSGKILSCEALRNAVDRFERDLVGMKKRGARWIFDEKEADRIIDFLEALQQFEEPFAGEYLLLQPWECFFLAQLYGWRDKKTRARRFRKALLFVGRKQGKTILASALTLYEILTKPGIEAYSLATKQEIANKALRNLKAFVARDDDLREMLKVYSYSIVNQGNFSIFRPLSRDSSLDGLNPAYVIIDELAAQRDGSAYTALTSGMGTRSEPLTVIISTAGYGLNNPLIEEYEYSKKILDGTIEDDSVLAMVYEYDKADTWDDLSTLLKSCPNLGVSVQLGYFDEELRQARVIPKKAAEYKVKYCNLWQSANDTWIPDKLWMRCVRAAQKYKPEISADMLAQAPCIIALDYSTIWDWTALSRYYYLKQLEKYLAFHRFYIPGDQVETKAYLETPS
ncbi:MAG: terminase large subunit, partial [Spirochaetales bacterium]